MDPKLRIEKGELLLQIKGKAYKIPRQVDLVEKHASNPLVLHKTRELARNYGVNFSNFARGTSCVECSHSSLIDKALNLPDDEALFHEGPDPDCRYVPHIDEVDVYTSPKVLFFFTRAKFMAKKPTCAVFDAFYTALAEQGLLKEYEVQAKPQFFRSINEFQAGSVLETQASDEYRASRI